MPWEPKGVNNAMGALAKPSDHGEMTPQKHVMVAIATNATDSFAGPHGASE